jgi:futalosine hydrolase
VRILVVTATALEVEPVLQRFVSATASPSSRIAPFAFAGHEVHVLTTGVGMVATSVWCSRALAGGPYDFALNVGVCGSFVARLPPGAVANVTVDRLAELGAEDDDAFLTAQDLGLLGDDEFPFVRGRLVNPARPDHPVLSLLPEASGITVSTAHGRDESIERMRALFNPDVESMEGAAFMYTCLTFDQPFAQVRAVSNVVERRNRAAWKLSEAIHALCDTTLRILEHL